MRVTTRQIGRMKQKGEKIVMITAYDYSTARMVDEAGIPMILVGDSLGMVMLGYETTIPVTLEMILHHTGAVVRGTKNALIVADMPFMSYRINEDEAVRNATRLLQEGGAQAVKLEGADTLPLVRRLVDSGIPVMGHIGLTPQSVNQLGGWFVQGKTPEAAERMLQEALALEAAGAFALVLETVPTALAGIISRRLKIPTIGIGAGPECDGQVQILHDMLGWYPDRIPKHARLYAKLADTMREAFSQYVRDVQSGSFPAAENSSEVDPDVFAALEQGTADTTEDAPGESVGGYGGVREG